MVFIPFKGPITTMTMRYHDITLRVTRLPMPALLALGTNAYAKMHGNLAFPEPPVSMEQMDIMINRFTGLISLATRGSKLALFQRNAFAREFADMLVRQAYYVRTCAEGRADVLASSGFPLRKVPEPMGVPAATTNIQARMGRGEGEIKVRWSPVKGAFAYTVFTKPCGSAGEWIDLGPTTRASFKLIGQASGTKHAFMVQAMGTAGNGLMSAMAIGMAA